jgi:hypothetical protein
VSEIAPLPTKEAYQAAVDRRLQLRSADERYEATLVRVSTAIDSPRQHCFSLLFRVAPELNLQQDNYVVDEAGARMSEAPEEYLGTHTLFMVPIKRDAQGLYLEAVFNLLR